MRGRMPVVRSEREPEDIQAIVRLGDGSKIPITIIERSTGGCTIRSLQALPADEIAQLEIPVCQPCAVTVRWWIGTKGGLKFIR